MVICILPKTGLGNQLFPLMKALVLAELNNDKFLVTGYHQVHLGTYLRREKSKRSYNGYFKFQKGFIGDMVDRYRVKRLKANAFLNEPPLMAVTARPFNACFQAVPHWKDFFLGLRPHRTLVRQLLWHWLTPDIRARALAEPAPIIGVHIRMGDYRKLRQNEDFSQTGLVRTPEPYFIEVIRTLRKIHGSELHVTVFTDGYRHEFEQLFSIGNIHLVEGNPDIVDMLLLSRSKIIVTSAGSTFSYWSGFLSDAAIILHPDHIHAPIRPPESADLYEGAADENSSLLRALIKKI